MRPFSSSKITHFLRPVCYVRCRGDQWSPAVKRTHPAHDRHTRIHHHDASSALQKCGNEAPTKPRVGRRRPRRRRGRGEEAKQKIANQLARQLAADPLTRAYRRARPTRGAKSAQTHRSHLPACRIIPKSHSLPFRKQATPEIPSFDISGVATVGYQSLICAFDEISRFRSPQSL